MFLKEVHLFLFKTFVTKLKTDSLQVCSDDNAIRLVYETEKTFSDKWL